MKKSLLIILILVLALSTALLSACDFENTFPELNEEGYTITVRYDVNGGVFADTKNVNIIDAYDINNMPKDADGNTSFKLIAPGDDVRGEDKSNSTASRTGYFLVGWYTERTPVLDDEGNQLDEEGNKVEDSEKYPAYTYSGYWDFANDYLTLDSTKDYISEQYALQLYAAWAPQYQYDFLAKNEDGEWESVGTKVIKSLDDTTLEMPSLNMENGGMDNNDVPAVLDKTIEGVFEDQQCTNAWTEDKPHPGSFDYEDATTNNTVKELYTTWKEGTWYTITSAEQMILGALNGIYDIKEDLDFANNSWPNNFTNKTFSGIIYGNSHTISNISIEQAEFDDIKGGLFGEIGENAIVQDVDFAGITYTIKTGSRKALSLGLLAGVIHSNSTVNNVTISGIINVDDMYLDGAELNMGLLAGINYNNQLVVDTSNITCVSISERREVSVDDNGVITVTAK